MTYARARLWLGITGVGSLVTLSTVALITGLPFLMLTHESSFGLDQLLQLSATTGLFVLWLLPLDFLGGYLLPKKYQKSDQSFGTWLGAYCSAIFAQAILFVAFGALILFSSQQFGILGGAMAITVGILTCFIVRNQMTLRREKKTPAVTEKLSRALSAIETWQIDVSEVAVVEHTDIGFTGGIVGLGKHARIVIPTAWLSFSSEQLAAAIARRAVAINSGSYSRGLLFAFVWNIAGFLGCSLLINDGLTSVAGLVSTVCCFTLWSFLGLLTLPTISRNASLEIDRVLAKQEVPTDLIRSAALTMDQLQDGEPERSRFIETIFHPVPNVASRNPAQPIGGLAAWNVARTTLFFSWACLGVLSRSVHCNLGRPELWTMLPTD